MGRRGLLVPTSCDMWFFITLTSLRGYILYILYIRSLRGRRGRGPHKTESVLDVTSRGSGFFGGSTRFHAGNAGCCLRSGAKLCWAMHIVVSERSTSPSACILIRTIIRDIYCLWWLIILHSPFWHRTRKPKTSWASGNLSQLLYLTLYKCWRTTSRNLSPFTIFFHYKAPTHHIHLLIGTKEQSVSTA